MLGWESYDGVTDCKYNECRKCRECRDLQQLALVVFFLPSTSTNTLLALGVVTLGNLHWWPCS